MTLPLASDIAAVTLWWARLDPNDRRTCYRPHELRTATGVDRKNLPHVLALLGWHRARRCTTVNGRSTQRTYYAPPGHQVPEPPRGRPTTATLIGMLLGHPDPYDLYPR